MPQFQDDIFLGNAPTFQGTTPVPAQVTINGTIATTTLTVNAFLSGDQVAVGQFVAGAGVTANTQVTADLGVNASGLKQYTVSVSQTVGPVLMTLAGQKNLGDASPMSRGVGPMGRSYTFDVIPQALQAANVAASQAPAGAGALTLTAGTSARSFVRADGVSVVQLDCPRALTVNTSTTARAVTVSGYDYYGQPMSEVITVSVAGTPVTGLKAFFQVASASIAGSATAVTVGTSDKIGLPIRVIDAGFILRSGYNNVLADDAGTFVAADTAVATTTTGDVRGTYLPSSATNGIKRLVVSIHVPAIGSGPDATRVGAFGQTQA